MKKAKQKNNEVIRDALIHLMNKTEENDDGISQIHLTKNPSYKITKFKTSEKGKPIIEKIKIGNAIMNAKHMGNVREFTGLQKGDYMDDSIYCFEKRIKTTRKNPYRTL